MIPASLKPVAHRTLQLALDHWGNSEDTDDPDLPVMQDWVLCHYEFNELRQLPDAQWYRPERDVCDWFRASVTVTLLPRPGRQAAIEQTEGVIAGGALAKILTRQGSSYRIGDLLGAILLIDVVSLAAGHWNVAQVPLDVLADEQRLLQPVVAEAIAGGRRML